MATGRYVYNIFWKDLLSGDFDIDSKKYKAVLLSPEYVFDPNHRSYEDVSYYELASRRSYIRGGVLVKLSFGADRYGRQVVNCDPVQWSAIDATFRYFTVYEKSTGNLVCTIDLGVNTSGGSRVDLKFPGGLIVIANSKTAENITHKIDVYKMLVVPEIPGELADDTIYYCGKEPGFFTIE